MSFQRSVESPTHASVEHPWFLSDRSDCERLCDCCRTGEMWADFMAKPLKGKLFQKFHKEIMGMSWINISSCSHRRQKKSHYF